MYACVCVGGGGLRSAHYVAKKNNKRKTKRKEIEEKNQKVDAQFVLGAPVTRCACGCMSGWVNLRLPATVDEPLTSARSQKKKKGRGGVAMISERRVRMLQHASFSPASCTFLKFFFRVGVGSGEGCNWLPACSHVGSMFVFNPRFLLWVRIK